MDRIEYLRAFEEQVNAIGAEQQVGLMESKVAVVGSGRVGSTMSNGMAKVGVGIVFGIDPGRLEIADKSVHLYSREADLAESKVRTLERFHADRRRWFQYIGIEAPVEAEVADDVFDRVDLAIICSNTYESRVAAERKARLTGTPWIGVAVTDARYALGGLVTIGQQPWAACTGCLTTTKAQRSRDGGEGLYFPSIALTTGLALNLATRILLGDTVEENHWLIEGHSRIEAMSVARREDCEACGAPR